MLNIPHCFLKTKVSNFYLISKFILGLREFFFFFWMNCLRLPQLRVLHCRNIANFSRIPRITTKKKTDFRPSIWNI